MSKNEEKNNKLNTASAAPEKEEYSLNDDRRVKVLSPGALVAKRFFRNRMAMVGLIILIAMFAFSFIGGLISPYAEDQLFYRTDIIEKEYASAIQNKDIRFILAEGQDIPSSTQNVIMANINRSVTEGISEFTFLNVTYHIAEEGTDLYSVALDDGTVVGFGYKDIFNPASSDVTLPYGLIFSGLKAYTNSETAFTYNGADYTIAEDGTVLQGGTEVGYISRYFVQAFMPDVFLTRAFKDELYEALKTGDTDFFFTDADGVEHEYKLYYDPQTTKYTIKQGTESRVYDTYSAPSSEHWLGTDGNGMDMLTRLMYGGRVSLLIGFIVELIATALGIILGGVAGFFGGWVDNLIMRIVDIFYCIPSLPIIIILGAAMDAMSVEPKVRMIYLMLILGFLGWPSLARMVRGQILSLREQEFMTATEACGVRVSRRIFKHLIPNVIPQLIVSCTMGLGSTIITEATLSFLGLGVRFPFASWGNIISDVNNTFVLTNYLFIWIPAGVLLLVTVLAFNIVGDGLRDAFDPKMKR